MIPLASRSSSYAIRVTHTNGGTHTEWIPASDVAQALAIAHTMYALDDTIASIRYAGVTQTIERR